MCLVVALRHEVVVSSRERAGSLGALYRRCARLSKCCSPSMRLKPPTSTGRAYGVLAAAGRYAAMSKRGCIAATAAARDSAVRAAVFAWLVAARDPKEMRGWLRGDSSRLFHRLRLDYGVHGQPPKAIWAAELASVLQDASYGCRRAMICFI